jgi:hypothetical protein
MTKNRNLLKRAIASLKEVKKFEEETIKKLVQILDNKLFRLTQKSNGNQWCENKNMFPFEVHYEKDRFVKKLFFGQYVEIYANIANKDGGIKITIDDNISEITTLSPKEDDNKLIFSRNDLTDNYHVLMIEVASGEADILKIITPDKIKETDCMVCEYMEADTKTKGDWIGKYGSFGYDIINYNTKIPSDIFLFYRYCNDWRNNNVYETSSDNINALQTFENRGRISADVYTLVSLSADITITGEHPKTISLYFCDYQNVGYAQQLTIIDRNSNDIVYSTEMKNFSDGIYLKFRLLGSFIINVKNISKTPETNATLSAVFVD